MRLNSIINTFLGKAIGVNLKRTKIRKVPMVQREPIFLELAGTSGVGKTTLYKNIFSKIKNNWFNVHEFREILKNVDYEIIESLPYYQELAQLKVKSVDSMNFSGINKMNLIAYFYSVLIDDSLVHLYNKSYKVISEDGLIHNFSECFSSLSKSGKEAFASTLKYRAIIYCHTTAEIVAERILERQREIGQLRPQHKVDSFQELILLQKKNLNSYGQFIDNLSKYNVPILSIDTSDPMHDNVQKAIEFMSKLTDKR